MNDLNNLRPDITVAIDNPSAALLSQKLEQDWSTPDRRAALLGTHEVCGIINLIEQRHLSLKL